MKDFLMIFSESNSVDRDEFRRNIPSEYFDHRFFVMDDSIDEDVLEIDDVVYFKMKCEFSNLILFMYFSLKYIKEMNEKYLRIFKTYDFVNLNYDGILKFEEMNRFSKYFGMVLESHEHESNYHFNFFDKSDKSDKFIKIFSCKYCSGMCYSFFGNLLDLILDKMLEFKDFGYDDVLIGKILNDERIYPDFIKKNDLILFDNSDDFYEKTAFFSKIYCINLKRREDRWKNVSKEFDEIGWKVDRFDAIDAKNSKFGILSGVQGEKMSHYEVFKNALDNKYSSVCVFEDDVIFLKNFKDLFCMMFEQLPDDWDFVYMGGNNVIKPEIISENIGRVKKTFAYHSYFLKLSTIEYLIKEIDKKLLRKEDFDIFEILNDGCKNVYIFNPRIVFQRPDFSDTMNRFVDYTRSLVDF